jgi:hypothetical protein
LKGVDKIREYVIAFVEGIDLHGKLHPNPECVSASDDALTFAAAGLENFAEHHFYDGTLNMSDSLGALSPLARTCEEPIENLITLWNNYPKQFKSISDFFIKLGLNLLGNIKPMIDRTIFVKNEIQGSGNTTAVVQTIAEMIKIEFGINKILKNPMMSDLIEDVMDRVLNYTWADPLAPNPVSDNLWNAFEGTYNLLTSSKFISQDNLVECQGAALNMVLYNQDAYAHFKQNDPKYTKQGLFSVFDSFTFLHQAVEGCTNTAVEIWERSALIDKELSIGTIWKNTLHNILFILSDGTYGYSSHYYQDFISLMDAAGDFLYRTVTYQVEKP